MNNLVDDFYLFKLSIKAMTTFLKYKVLTEFYNLKLDLVKSKIDQKSEKYFESILSNLQNAKYFFQVF